MMTADSDGFNPSPTGLRDIRQRERTDAGGEGYPPPEAAMRYHAYLIRRVHDRLLTNATRGLLRWDGDETYVKVAGRWRYVYRAVDEHGQVIDV